MVLRFMLFGMNRQILSGLGALVFGALLKWVPRVLDLIGIAGVPDDLSTWQKWLSDKGSVILFLCGFGLVLWGVFGRKGVSAPAPAAHSVGTKKQERGEVPWEERSNKPWYEGLQNIRVRDAACAFAGTWPENFKNSQRAQLISRDILHEINTGRLLTADETASIAHEAETIFPLYPLSVQRWILWLA